MRHGKNCTVRGKLFFFLEADLKVQDVLRSECESRPQSALIYAVVSMNVQLFRRQEDCDITVDTPIGITVV